MISTNSIIRLNQNVLTNNILKVNSLIINNTINNNNGRIHYPQQQLQQRRNVNVFAEFSNSLKRQSKENKEFKESVLYFSNQKKKIAATKPAKLVKNTVSKTKAKITNTNKEVENYFKSDSTQTKIKNFQLKLESFGNGILNVT